LSNVVVESVTGMDIVTVLEMPDGLSGQEVASVPGMDLAPSTGRWPVALPTRCAHDVNGDHKLTVDDVLRLLDASEDAEACVLQIVQELNKLRLKP